MGKRSKRKAVKVDTGGGWTRIVITAGITALLVSFAGWWLFASKSESKLKQAVYSRVSVMVDRIDDLSEAWKNREVPYESSTDGKSKNVIEEPAGTKPPRPDTYGARQNSHNKESETETTARTETTTSVIDNEAHPDEQVRLRELLRSTESKYAEKSKADTDKKDSTPKDPPPREVGSEDQKELRELLKNLN